MDRFIVPTFDESCIDIIALKSNMDRFIVQSSLNIANNLTSFKIQYGQIYRAVQNCYDMYQSNFKIQYGQIYRIFFRLQSQELKALKSNMDRFIANTKRNIKKFV